MDINQEREILLKKEYYIKSESGQINLLNAHRSTAKHILQSAVVSICSINIGFQLGAYNLINDQNPSFFFKDCNQDSQIPHFAMLNALLALGAILGAFLFGKIIKKRSRKKLIFLTDFSIATLSLFYFVNYWKYQLIVRFLIGICLGFNSALIPQYIKEVSPPHISQKTGFMNQAFINIGIFLGYVCQGVLITTNDLMNIQDHQTKHYYLQFGLYYAVPTFFFASIRSIIYCLCYNDVSLDSRYYFFELQKDEFQPNIVQIRQKMYKEEYIVDMIDFFQAEEDYVQRQINNNKWWAEKRSLVGIFVTLFQQFSGINALVYYSTYIFEYDSFGEEYSKQNKRFSIMLSLLLGIFIAIFQFANIFIKKGKHKLLVYGSLINGFLMLCVSICGFCYYQQVQKVTWIIIVISIFIFILSYSITYGPTSWTYNADILYEKELATIIATNWFCSMIISIIIPFVLIKYHYLFSYIFLIFSGMSFLGFYLLKRFIRNVDGKFFNQIIDLFQKNK